MQDWRYFLCKSPAPGVDPTLPLETIQWLTKASGRSLNLAMERSGECSFNYPMLDRWAGYMFGGTQYAIQCERNGQIIWSGPLATNAGETESSKSGSANVKAVGWLELLTVRELREDVTYGATNPATGNPWTDAEIVFDLLARIIGYDPLHAPPIRVGNAYGTRQVRQEKWQKGTKIEQCFRDLMEVEAGVSITVNPANRTLDVYAWDYFDDHPEIVFGFNKPPFNVAKFGWNVDNFKIRNRMLGMGQNNTTVLVEDTSSQDLYGIFEETVNLPGVLTQDALLGYVGAEIALRAKPWLFYTFTPKASDARSVPLLGVDFNLGDVCRLSVDYGPIQEDQRSVRMFGVGLSIGDDGTERMSSVQTTAGVG